MTPTYPTLETYVAALEARHLADLTFPQVRRAIQSLSERYVARRLGDGSKRTLDGRGKRAAFALYFGPLHLATIDHVLSRLPAAEPAPRHVLDLGCGTGVAGAAWALRGSRPARVTGVDRNRWAVGEASWTYRTLGLTGSARVGDLARASIETSVDAIVAGYAINELVGDARNALLDRCISAASRGVRVLVVEPIARRVTPWWDRWAEAFEAAGGRADVWRAGVDLPETLRRFDRAARIDHREVTARSLFHPGGG